MEGVLSRPFPPRSHSGPVVRINGKIRAREVRVIGDEGQLGVFSLPEAINMARAKGVDLVEVAPNATPPVCRLVDFGKYRYEQAKKEKESKKHQHANRVKEIQLSPSIDPHDFKVKLGHAVDFLCEDMKVKVNLRFRGREMAHKEFGFQQVENFIKELAPYAHADSEPKLVGRGVTVMISPLPRNKRAKHPTRPDGEAASAPMDEPAEPPPASNPPPRPVPAHRSVTPLPSSQGGFTNNPFAALDLSPETSPAR
ncbi:MAG: translation initiation factor IF-3 [Verrucomicrobia bacterium]|nr:translation initiation factor IF-3 [Verrucomicrobiota bacterium]